LSSVLHLCLGWHGLWPSIYASYVAGMTGVNYHAQLLLQGWDGGLSNIFPGVDL
jgi:hypothetical protein